MSPAEQENLFAKLRSVHPKWTPRFTSGYVHGAKDERERAEPPPQFAREHTEYAHGYLLGFAVHRGEDAEVEPWFATVGELVQEARRGEDSSPN